MTVLDQDRNLALLPFSPLGLEMIRDNWTSVADAVTFYKQHGFTYVDTPWLVSNKIAAYTSPSTNQVIQTNYYGVSLVGSAEQGFMALAINNKLPKGVNFVSAGPCFRNEPKLDDTHHLTFFKVELFVKVDDEDVAVRTARRLAVLANKFMPEAVLVTTDIGYDLEVNGIEVGSYGHRYHQDIGWWAYGTGLAVPRYEYATNSIS